MGESLKSLGDFPKIKRNIKIWDKKYIKALHIFIYHKSGGRERRAEIREFSGFTYLTNDERYEKKVQVVNERLSTSDLLSICAILDIPTDAKDLTKHIFKHLIVGNLLKYDPRGDSDDAGGGNETNASPADEAKDNASSANKKVVKTTGKTIDDDLIPQSWKGATSEFNSVVSNYSDFLKPFGGHKDYPVERWLVDFEDAAYSLQLSEWQKFILGKNSLKGLARSVVEGRSIYKWDDLKIFLLRKFRSTMSGKALHEALKSRKKKKDETAFEYFRQMKMISEQGSLRDLDLIDYIIEGTPDDPWKFVLYGAANMAQFRQKLRDYDYLTNRHNEIMSRALGSSSDKANEPGKGNASKGAETSEFEKLICVKCKKSGHTAISCPEHSGGAICARLHNCAHMQSYQSALDDMRLVAESFNGLPRKEVYLKGKRLYAMIDSGSQLNLINYASYHRIGSPILKTTILFLRGFGRAKVPPKGYFEDTVQIDGYSFNTRFYVVGDDVLKRDVIIGSTLLQQAEFTFRRNEILIRKLEKSELDEEPKTTVPDKNVERPLCHTPCKCVARKQETMITPEPQTTAGSIEGSSQDRKLLKVVNGQQTMASDIHNGEKKNKEKALEYQRKFRCADELISNLKKGVNSQVIRKIADKAESCNIPGPTSKPKKDNVSRIIFMDDSIKEDPNATEAEQLEELQRKCAILEKNLIEVTKDCTRLRKENKSFVDMLSEEKLKQKKLTDQIPECRPPGKTGETDFSEADDEEQEPKQPQEQQPQKKQAQEQQPKKEQAQQQPPKEQTQQQQQPQKEQAQQQQPKKKQAQEQQPKKEQAEEQPQKEQDQQQQPKKEQALQQPQKEKAQQQPPKEQTQQQQQPQKEQAQQQQPKKEQAQQQLPKEQAEEQPLKEQALQQQPQKEQALQQQPKKEQAQEQQPQKEQAQQQLPKEQAEEQPPKEQTQQQQQPQKEQAQQQQPKKEQAQQQLPKEQAQQQLPKEQAQQQPQKEQAQQQPQKEQAQQQQPQKEQALQQQPPKEQAQQQQPKKEQAQQQQPQKEQALQQQPKKEQAQQQQPQKEQALQQQPKKEQAQEQQPQKEQALQQQPPKEQAQQQPPKEQALKQQSQKQHPQKKQPQQQKSQQKKKKKKK